MGGFFDTEFEREIKLLFQRIETGEVIFVESSVLRQELERAPEQVRTLLNKYPKDCLELVMLTDEARELADRYIAENVVGHTSLDDCRHIALATIYKVDVLVSWNFKHIVTLTRIKGYNGVNLKNDYQTLEVRNPKDLVDYGKKNDCLKMKEEIQAKVYEKTKDMTFPKLRAYLDKNLENNAFWQRLIRRDKAKKQTVF